MNKPCAPKLKNNLSNLFIITGACGTGKSSLVPGLKKHFPDFEVYDFDDYGVPENPTVEWRREATLHWLEIVRDKALRQTKTILAGLIAPADIQEFTRDSNLTIRFCLLDIDQEERAFRLIKRGATQELIDDLEELTDFPQWLSESIFEYIVIDTTKLTIGEVTEKVTEWIEVF